MGTATKAESQPMTLSKAQAVLDSYQVTATQVPDEIVDALRLMMEFGAAGEDATKQVFGFLMSNGKQLTEPQKARLLAKTGAKGEATIARHAMIGEIICHEKVTVRRSDKWESLRTAVNKAAAAGVFDQILGAIDTAAAEQGDKPCRISHVVKAIEDLIPSDRIEATPETTCGGNIKSAVNYLTRVNDFVQSGGKLDEEMEAGVARAESLLKAIRGK